MVALANLVYQARRDIYVPFGASEVIVRALLGTLAPTIMSIWVPSNGDNTGASFTIGNPRLAPFRSTNFDASLKWYFTPSSLISIADLSKQVSFPQVDRRRYPSDQRRRRTVAKDLETWHYPGLVWSIQHDGTWKPAWRMRASVPFRASWSPEIYFIRGDYHICRSISRAGLAILKSTTGLAAGPCIHAFYADKPIRGGIDVTLFEDHGKSVWFIASADGWDPIRGIIARTRRFRISAMRARHAAARATCARSPGWSGSTSTRAHVIVRVDRPFRIPTEDHA